MRDGKMEKRDGLDDSPPSISRQLGRARVRAILREWEEKSEANNKN